MCCAFKVWEGRVSSAAGEDGMKKLLLTFHLKILKLSQGKYIDNQNESRLRPIFKGHF